MNSNNFSVHGCALVLGATGLIIRGKSGSGKSGLAHILIDRWKMNGRYARWISDDRVILNTCSGRVLAGVPSHIEGKMERRFMGIETYPIEHRCVIDLVIDLVPFSALDRLPAQQSTELLSTCPLLPMLRVPELAVSHAADLVSAQVLRIGR